MSRMDKFFRKHDPRLPRDVSERFLIKAGHVMAILRPEDPERKLKGLERIPDGTPHEIAQPIFDELLSEQPHQFIGYAARSGVKGIPAGAILDKWGHPIDTMKPGDSFVGCGTGTPLEPPAFQTTGHFHMETWDGVKVMVLPTPDLKMDSNTGIVMEGTGRGGLALRGGITEPDCHIPTLNRIWTGDPEIYWKYYKRKPGTANEQPPEGSANAGGNKE